MKKKIVAMMMLAGACVFAKNTVAFVNVGGAVDSMLLTQTVTNGVMGVIPINHELASQEKFDPAEVIAATAKGHPVNGGRIICVYFVDSPSLPPQLTAPGFFAAINVRGLSKGADRALYEKRLLKIALKGLAFACGFGANQDVGRCVMGAGSFETLKGIDGTSATYSPFVFFPLSDYLQARGLLDETPPKFE